jgi:hypothetical protein
MELDALKARYGISQAWRDLGLSGEPGKSCRSPLRPERKPSFSVYEDDRRWKDFGTGESGDVIDLVGRVQNLDTAAAIAWIEERLGVERQPPKKSYERPASFADGLCFGSSEQRATLAALRSLSLEAVAMAERWGVLRFGTLFDCDAWAVTDSARGMVEWRRLDGRPWAAYGRLPERKAHCKGHGKARPVGLGEAEEFGRIVFLEGAPDLLAAFHFLIAEGKTETVAPVAMLGAASHRIEPDAAERFRGKRVRFVPHLDEAGMKAMKAWARQLRDAGASVEAFDLSGLVMDDGKAGKDLNDLCRINPDCYEANPKFQEVMP